MTADRSRSPADLVVTGGTILTLDAAGTRATAMAVRGGRIVVVGTGAEVRAHIGRSTRVIELAGRTVLPGINDSHLHATWLGAIWPHTLMGSGGFSAPAGDIVRLRDGADRRAAITRAGDVCAALGITSYTEAGLGPGEDDGATGCFSQGVLDDYAALAAQGALRARVTVLRLFGLLDGTSTLADFEQGIRTDVPKSDPECLNVTGVKIFADGIPPMRSAWTRHRYPDGSSGGLLVDGADAAARERHFRRMIDLAHAAGLQIGVHATGDRAIDIFIDAVATAVRRCGPGGRHYVVHGDLVTPAQLARMAELGMGITVQPGIATATSGMVADMLGTSAAAAAWPLAAMLSAGVALTLSSDGPVLHPDWRRNIADAARLLEMGAEVRPDLMESLLRCYTTAAAVQDGAEDWKGSLEPGKVADFCVLTHDPLTVPPADLPNVDVDHTVVGGTVVFTHPRCVT